MGDFADYIKKIRKQLGLTAEEFAAKCGMGLDWVRSVENRRLRKPSAPTLRRLAERLSIPIDELRAVAPSEVAVEDHRVLVPPDLWDRLVTEAGYIDVSPQEYAVTLLARGLEIRESDKAKPAPHTEQESHVPQLAKQAAVGSPGERGQSQQAKKRRKHE